MDSKSCSWAMKETGQECILEEQAWCTWRNVIFPECSPPYSSFCLQRERRWHIYNQRDSISESWETEERVRKATLGWVTPCPHSPKWLTNRVLALEKSILLRNTVTILLIVNPPNQCKVGSYYYTGQKAQQLWSPGIVAEFFFIRRPWKGLCSGNPLDQTA